MGFFKDFKDDFSQAVNELVPGEDSLGTEDELLVDTLEGEPDMEAELSKLDGLLEQVSRQEERKEAEKRESQKETKEENDMSDIFTTAAGGSAYRAFDAGGGLRRGLCHYAGNTYPR